MKLINVSLSIAQFSFIHLYLNLSEFPNIQFLRFARDLNTTVHSNKYLYDTEGKRHMSPLRIQT